VYSSGVRGPICRTVTADGANRVQARIRKGRIRANPRFAAWLLALAGLAGCGRSSAPRTPERVAILRFENLGADVSDDWMGRALSEVIGTELAGAGNVRVIGSAQLHGLDGVLGVRPVSAPGVSAERDLALAAGANRIGYGDYTVRAGRIEARLAIEDPGTGKTVQVVTASAAAGDVLGAASALVHEVSARATVYATRSQAALREYAMALEAKGEADVSGRLEAAIAADPNFGAPYQTLAHLKIARGDRAGALATLQQALARGGIGAIDRARLEVEAASLGGDPAARRQSLAALARLEPADPAVWRALGETALNGRDYGVAVQSFRQALALDPEDVAALNQLGYAATYAGDLAAGIQALETYRKLRPNDPNALDTMGDANLIAGRLGEAERFYLEANKKDPNFQAGGDLFKAAMARLMTGDRTGADGLDQKYLDARTAARDPLVGYRKAQWSWVSGRRKAACEQLEGFARDAEKGPLGEVASRAYAELAIWKRLLGDREGAAAAALKSGLSSATSAALARFLNEPRASAAEWAERAARLVPGPESPAREQALAYALLLDGEFRDASEALRKVYASTPATPTGESLAVLLAWSYIETGRYQEAAPLVRFNPVPSPDGPSPLMGFWFPRIYALRGREAAQSGRTSEARADLDLFRGLSGADPLVWDERKAP
jgi:tetratricopeptide (TPR) repeat protein